MNGHLSVVDFLCNNGADINAIGQHDELTFFNGHLCYVPYIIII